VRQLVVVLDNDGEVFDVYTLPGALLGPDALRRAKLTFERWYGKDARDYVFKLHTAQPRRIDA
jgi:hypothetical protein